MSKYLRCFLLMFVYLLVFEFTAMLVLSSFHPDVPGLINSGSLPLPSLLIWAFVQFVIAYLFCVLLSRTDSTTTQHTMLFAGMVGLIISIVQYGSFAIDANYWPIYVVIVPLSILKFTIAGWVFTKLQ